MAQTQVLAAGTTAATSTDITLAAGAHAQVSGFAAGGQWGEDGKAELRIDTNGDDAVVFTFSQLAQSVHIIGPGTYRVYRPAQSKALGFSSET